MRSIAVLLIAVLSLTGCASTETVEEAPIYEQYIERHQLEELDKIASFRFDDWRSLDDRHLIISTSFTKPYLITLKHRCIDLADAHVIGVDNKGSTLNARFDSIHVLERPQSRCFIKTIHRLTREQADEIVRLR